RVASMRSWRRGAWRARARRRGPGFRGRLRPGWRRCDRRRERKIRRGIGIGRRAARLVVLQLIPHLHFVGGHLAERLLHRRAAAREIVLLERDLREQETGARVLGMLGILETESLEVRRGGRAVAARHLESGEREQRVRGMKRGWI